MGRRRNTIIDDLWDIGAALPWWITLILAGGAYLLLHNLAGIEVTPISSHRGIPTGLVWLVIKTVSYYAQYGVPAILGTAAVASLVKRKQRSSLFNFVTKGDPSDKLDSLSWQQFEDLVHEFFRRKGYVVSETSKGADGGVDLRLRKDGKAATVQCKHWRNKKVGVNVIREQFGIMADEAADEGFVVTSGQFTEEAYAFAKDKPLQLVDGKSLRRHLGIFAWDHLEERQVDREPLLSCPRCGSDMRLRTARKGKSAGTDFWGCSRFPKCRGTRQAD